MIWHEWEIQEGLLFWGVVEKKGVFCKYVASELLCMLCVV